MPVMQKSVRSVVETLVTYANNGPNGIIPVKHMVNPGAAEEQVQQVFGKLDRFGFKNDYEQGTIPGHHHFKNRGFIVLHQSRHHAFTTFGEISMIGAKRYMPWVALCMAKAKELGGYPQVQSKMSVQGAEAGAGGNEEKMRQIIWQFVAKTMGVKTGVVPDEKNDAKLFALFDLLHDDLDHPAEEIPHHIAGLHHQHSHKPEAKEVVNQLHRLGIDLDGPKGEIKQFDVAKIKHDPSLFVKAQDLGILTYDQHGNIINYMLESADLASKIIAYMNPAQKAGVITEQIKRGELIWGDSGTKKLPEPWVEKNGVRYLWENSRVNYGGDVEGGNILVMTEDGYTEPIGFSIYPENDRSGLLNHISRHSTLMKRGMSITEAAQFMIAEIMELGSGG